MFQLILEMSACDFTRSCRRHYNVNPEWNITNSRSVLDLLGSIYSPIISGIEEAQSTIEFLCYVRLSGEDKIFTKDDRVLCKISDFDDTFLPYSENLEDMCIIALRHTLREFVSMVNEAEFTRFTNIVLKGVMTYGTKVYIIGYVVVDSAFYYSNEAQKLVNKDLTTVKEISTINLDTMSDVDKKVLNSFIKVEKED